MPGSCSLAVHALLNELEQPVELILAKEFEKFTDISPRGTVPVLDDDGLILTEGAAIILHLVDKHSNQLLAVKGVERAKSVKWLMFANATMHTAYGRLFFGLNNIENKEQQLEFFHKCAASINLLWQDVDAQLAKTKFISGEQPSPADFLLTIFANWGQYFPIEINFGENVSRMLKDISNRPSFQTALEKEQVEYIAA